MAALEKQDDGSTIINLTDDYNLPDEFLKQIGLLKSSPGGELENMGMPMFIFPKDTNRIEDLDPSRLISEPELKDNLFAKIMGGALDKTESVKDYISGKLQEAKDRKESELTDGAPPGKEIKLSNMDAVRQILKEAAQDRGPAGPGGEPRNKFGIRDILGFEKSGKDYSGTYDSPLGPITIGDDKSDKETVKETKPNAPGGNTKTEEKLNDFEIKLKDKPEPPSKVKMLLNKMMEKDDFLMDLGLRLMQGEGLFPGAIKAAKTQKKADQTEASTELANLITEATIKEKLSGTKEERNAAKYASLFSSDPKSDAYLSAYKKYFEMDLNDKNSKADLSDLGNLMIASAINKNGDIDKDMIQRLINQSLGIVDSPLGNINVGDQSGQNIQKEYITAS